MVDYRRNGVSETTIHGAVAWCHGDEVIHSFGGNVLCYGRSMMKPFMIKEFTEELKYCSWEQKAISVASHNGDTEHVAAAQSLLAEAEWPLMLDPTGRSTNPIWKTGKKAKKMVSYLQWRTRRNFSGVQS